MVELHRLLWAKSAGKETPDNWKPVLAHLLDVAACAWELLLLEPVQTLDLYARDLGYPETAQGRDAALRWTCALVALHDLGKASPAFQQQWKDWPRRGDAAVLGLSWPDGPTGPSRTPVVSHSLISQATLPRLLNAHGWDCDVARHLADAVGAHHGFRAKSTELKLAKYPKERGQGTWEEARQELYDAVCAALKVPQPPSIQTFTGGPYMRLAGLTSFADWIGSSFELERFEHAQLDDPAVYLELARMIARQKLKDIGWEPRTPLTFSEVFQFPARPLQQAAEKLLSGVSAPGLLLVEAPMGEGKTELALYAHLELQRLLHHRGCTWLCRLRRLATPCSSAR